MVKLHNIFLTFFFLLMFKIKKSDLKLSLGFVAYPTVQIVPLGAQGNMLQACLRLQATPNEIRHERWHISQSFKRLADQHQPPYSAHLKVGKVV